MQTSHKYMTIDKNHEINIISINVCQCILKEYTCYIYVYNFYFYPLLHFNPTATITSGS